VNCSPSVDFALWWQRHSFWWRQSVSLVLGPAPNSLQVFYTIWQLFKLKNKTLRTPKQPSLSWRWLKPPHSAASSWCLVAVITNAASAGDFLHMDTPTWTSTSSGCNPPPPLPIIWAMSGRRPEKVHSTELLHTLYIYNKYIYICVCVCVCRHLALLHFLQRCYIALYEC
jgi:hypothetical protein